MATSKPTSSSETDASGPLAYNSKFFFDDTLVVLQIERMLFKVHKHQLVKSEVFADMFAIAERGEPTGKPLEGTSVENPIKLEGVSASDFECLLTVLYAGLFSTRHPEPDASLIIPAFQLAIMWNFEDLRAYLMPLAEKLLGDVDKIVFSRRFGVDAWSTPAYTRLCKRKQPLNSEEAAKIGLEGVLLISRIREDWPTNINNSRVACCTTPIRCSSCKSGYSAHAAQVPEGMIEEKIETWVKNGRVFT